MATVKRDRASILGLKAQLGDLESRVQELFDSGLLSVEDRDLLNKLTATEAVNLDEAVTSDKLATNISDLESNTLAANVTAIREYVLGALQMGGPSVTVETPMISSGGITLTYSPHEGINGILNYGKVQLDLDGQIHHLKLTATADPYRFLVDPKGLDIEGYEVSVQYMYHYDARDLNQLIGEMILDGLVLIEPA